MSRPGPRPLPTGIRPTTGQRRDRLNPAEPLPELDTDPPEPPASLCEEAQTKWRRLAPELHRAGVLTSWDLEAFAAYCDLSVQAERARAILAHGLLINGRRDRFVTNPAWRIYRDILVLLRAYAIEFGLTPSARSQIRALPSPRSHGPAASDEEAGSGGALGRSKP